MKRREVLFSLAGAAGVRSIQARRSVLPPEAVEELMRARGLDPRPGEAAQVRAFLLSTSPTRTLDPRIEPSLRLDPELDG